MKRIVITMLMLAFLAAPVATTFAAEVTPVAQQSKKAEVKTVVFSTNLKCKNCVKKVNENLSVTKGVKSLDVNLEKQKITIGYDPTKTDEKTLAAAIVKLGYKADKEVK